MILFKDKNNSIQVNTRKDNYLGLPIMIIVDVVASRNIIC